MKQNLLISFLFGLITPDAQALKLTNQKEKFEGTAPFYSDDYFGTGYSGFPGTHDHETVFAPKYEREMPQHFANKHLDDMFMHSMIDTYAKE